MDKKNKNNIAKILLAFGVLASPMMLANQVSADNTIANTTNTNNIESKTESDAVTTENVINENKEEKQTQPETNVAENTATDVTEATETTSQTEEKSDENTEIVEDKEEVDFKLDASQRHELKEAGYSDEEIQEIENSIIKSLTEDSKFNVYDFIASKVNDKKAEPEKDALEISEEKTPENQQAGETTEDAITNVEITIGGAKNKDKTTTVNPTANTDRIDTTDTDLNLETKIDFDIPEGTKAGRTFDVEISDNVNFNGIVAEEEVIPVMYNNKVVVATGEKLTDGRRGYRYTFNENIDGLTDVRVSLAYPLFIDPETVPNNSEKETVTVKVAGKEVSKDFKVEYENGVFDYVQGGPTLSGSANITDVTSDTYEHIIYVNPTADQEVKNPHILIQNQEGYNTATFDDDVKNSVKVYRIKNTDDFNLSYHLDYNNLEEVTANVEVVEDLFGPEDAPKQLKVDITNNDFKNDVYVVTYKGKREAKKATKTLVEFTADRRKFTNENGQVIETGATNADFGWKWRNEILFDDPDANSTGEEKPTDPVEKKGSFKETHVYITKDFEGNVLEDKTITEVGKSSEGTKDEKYESSKVDKDGYELVKVTADQGSDEVTISKDGKSVEAGNYVEEKELAVTYEYVKQPGRFVEHHIYQTVDKEGNVISTDETVDVTEKDGKKIEGFSNENVSTDKKNKDGYTFKEATEIKLQNDDSEKTYTNYVPGKVLEKTYIYTKTQIDWTPIEETGKFQEHHIYITKDKDGKEIKREVVDGDVSGGTKDMTYETGKKEKDGFGFVRTENPVEEPSYNEKGESTTGNFKPGVKQEITYVYEKTESEWTPIEETGKFQEHHIYVTKDKDGKEIKRDIVPGEVSGGTKDMTYTTGKKEKDGFKFVRTENPVEDPSYNEKGESTTGNFKPGVKQEITYVYEKTESEWTPIEETGKFQEHHIYITKDKDGKEIKRDIVPGEVSGGTKDMTYTTGKKEKDGFKFVRTENPVEEPSYNEKGETTTGNFKPGVKQEITYVYEKTETPWTPLEPSEPVTPVEPEEPTTPVTPAEPEEPTTPVTPVEPEEPTTPVTPAEPEEPTTPVTPAEPEEPTTPVTPEKPNEDPKETPWTPLTPAEEVTPQTPDDNETPKDEPKETPKEDSKETPKKGSKETSEKKSKKQSKKLPKAGADYELLQLAAGALTIVSGMGISLSRKKRD